VERFLENPYWQYFCGYEYFHHKYPLEPTSLVKWRKRVGEEGIEKMFYQTLKTARKLGFLKDSHLNKVNIDTTVQEKAIAYPTDARLYNRMREKLVKFAKKMGIELRQTYARVAKKALIMQGRYSHARQMKRAAKETKTLKTILGRVTRELKRKVTVNITPEFERLLQLSERLFNQKKNDKEKLYSIHEPEVECIAKGKASKKYEFGCKVSVASTSRDNWVLGIKAHHGNPYDGHTLSDTVSQVEKMADKSIKEAFTDRGYRGHNYSGDTVIHIVGTKHNMSRSLKKWSRRRSAIEPVIGHLKSDNRMNRNYLKGIIGDNINALLCGCGANIRKLIAAFFLPLLLLPFLLVKSNSNLYPKLNLSTLFYDS
jgi:IS5 family transposase